MLRSMNSSTFLEHVCRLHERVTPIFHRKARCSGILPYVRTVPLEDLVRVITWDQGYVSASCGSKKQTHIARACCDTAREGVK